MTSPEIHNVAFPFIKVEYSGPKDGEFVDDTTTFRPGTRFESELEDGNYGGADEEWQADGMGLMVLEVVGRFKPGKYAERTFYVRSFIDPAGRAFGKKNLRVISSAAFKRMLKGYRHEFTLPETEAA